MMSLILNFIVILNNWSKTPIKPLTTLATISLMIMWIKVFYFLRLFSTTAYLMRMIIEVTIDARYFLFMFVFAITAFSNSFFILA